MIHEAQIPAFGPDVSLRFDADSKAWVLLSPNKRYLPNEVAAEILQLVDGARPIDSMLDLLAERYTAPRVQIAKDVLPVLEDLAGQGVLELREPPQWKLSLSMFVTWVKLLFRRRNHD